MSYNEPAQRTERLSKPNDGSRKRGLMLMYNTVDRMRQRNERFLTKVKLLFKHRMIIMLETPAESQTIQNFVLTLVSLQLFS